MIRNLCRLLNLSVVRSVAGTLAFSCMMFIFLDVSYAQKTDCERLSQIEKFRGTFQITGTANSSTTSINESINGFIELVKGPGPTSCDQAYWYGSLVGSAKGKKVVTTDCGTSTHVYTIEGSGTLRNSSPNAAYGRLDLINMGKDVYTLTFRPAFVPAVSIVKVCDGNTRTNSADNYPFGYEYFDIPLPTGNTLSGTYSYEKDVGTHVMKWQFTWHLSPTDTLDCPSYKAGSILACENQALGEEVRIIGSLFSLHYQSDRVSGRADADIPAIAHANHLAGWTLDAHHAYDVEGHVLYLGNGGRRSGDALGHVPPTSSGDFIIADESGALVYVFNSKGQHSETRDALTGNVLFRFDYNSSLQLITVTDGDGNETKIERATDGKPTAIVGSFGQRTLLLLDSNGYLASITNPADESVLLSSSPNGLLTSMTDPRGNVHYFKYSEDGRLIEDKDPGGHTQTLSRSENANGYTAKLVTAENLATSYAVESGPTGKRRVTILPNGLQSVSEQDFDDKRISINADGTKTTMTVKPDPRFGMQSPLVTTSVTMPSGLVSTVTKDRIANVSDPADPLSFTTLTDSVKFNGRGYTNTYDRTTSTFTAVTPEGRQTKTALDAKGRVTQNQVAGLVPTEYTYDNQGRLKTFLQGTGGATRTTTLDYNDAGFLESITDPLGQVWKSSFDAAGRVTNEVLPDKRTIHYTYDKNGNVTGITPPGRPEHKFTYTPLGLSSSYVPPDILPGPEETTNSYNADRQLKQVMRPDGQTLDVSYDLSGRLKSLDYAQNALSYDYHPSTGKVVTIAAPGSTLSFKYDGSLLTGEKWSGPVLGTVNRTYDNSFRVISRSVNGGNPINLQYDNDGLLIKAGDITIARDVQSGLIKETTLGSLTDKWSYDEFGELKGYRAEGHYTVEYDRDKLGRITEMRETVGGETAKYSYDYDLAGRLHEVQKDGVTTATYLYDGNGNRTTVTSATGTITGAYDDHDRLTQYGNTTYTYTANGELLSKKINSETTKYRYDVPGNLIELMLPEGKKITYIIDGRNRRIGKKVDGTLVQAFLYQDSLRPIAELDGSNTIVSRFVYATHINVPDYMIKAGVTYRIVTDHLGSPRSVVDVATGTVAQRIDYDEFGKVTSDSNPGFQPFGFAGGILDQHTKLTRFGSRDYDAMVGRWTSKDPIGFNGGDTNLYAYVADDPVNFVDSEGLASKGQKWRVIFEAIKQLLSPEDADKVKKVYKDIDEIVEQGPKKPRKAPRGTAGALIPINLEDLIDLVLPDWLVASPTACSTLMCDDDHNGIPDRWEREKACSN